MDDADLFTPAQEGASTNGYVTLRVDEAACSPALLDDLRGIAAARWLAEALRQDFEQACYGARVYGASGSFDGVVAERMPDYWRRTGASAGGVPVWAPDARHPVGKLMADLAARLLPLPSPEVLDGVLRRHGIEGSRDLIPQMKEIEGGWAILVHRPKGKAKTLAPGVTRDESLVPLWFLRAA